MPYQYIKLMLEMSARHPKSEAKIALVSLLIASITLIVYLQRFQEISSHRSMSKLSNELNSLCKTILHCTTLRYAKIRLRYATACFATLRYVTLH